MRPAMPRPVTVEREAPFELLAAVEEDADAAELLLLPLAFALAVVALPDEAAAEPEAAADDL